jgi:hypothetical protein
MIHLINKVNQDPPFDIRKMNYSGLFVQCGVSIPNLFETAMSMIEPEIIDFQEKTLSPEL